VTTTEPTTTEPTTTEPTQTAPVTGAAGMTGATAPEVEAARMLLARMGLTVEDLLGAPQASVPAGPPAPTFSEYIAVLTAANPPGLRLYRGYWKRIEARWGSRRITECKPSDIRWLIADMLANQIVANRRTFRGGVNAERNMIAAFRSLYQHAEADGLISAAENPAQKVKKPRRQASTRRAVPDKQLAEINEVVATTGDDPGLDTLLMRLHTETACRVGGALALRPCDLNQRDCTIRLREKGGTIRWQPVTRTLMAALVAHADERGAPPDGQLLRYGSARPITRRRYDCIWRRVGQRLPWVARQGITTHWLRHTTLTWVERNFGYAVARAYAGHAEQSGSDAGTTSTYVKATVAEVAAALSALTGEPHPLAEPTTDEQVTAA
jgi:integrase